MNIVSANDLQKKVEEFGKVIDVPMTVLMATKKDRFRKPETGMWHLFIDQFSEDSIIDVQSSVKYFLPSSLLEILLEDLQESMDQAIRTTTTNSLHIILALSFTPQKSISKVSLRTILCLKTHLPSL